MGAEGAMVPAAASPEAQLIARIQAGQAEAEAELYHRYSERIYYLGLRETRSSADADDIRAETFLRVLCAIRGNRLHSVSSLAGYIVGVTRNVLHEFRRRPAFEDVTQFEDLAACTPSNEEVFVNSEVQKAIERTLARLRPRERNLLRMHYFEELPRGEIARRAGIAEERVRLVKSRALKHFREAYSRLNQTGKR